MARRTNWTDLSHRARTSRWPGSGRNRSIPSRRKALLMSKLRYEKLSGSQRSWLELQALNPCPNAHALDSSEAASRAAVEKAGVHAIRSIALRSRRWLHRYSSRT